MIRSTPWLIGVMLVTLLLGSLGGAALGGAAGYWAATRLAAPAPVPLSAEPAVARALAAPQPMLDEIPSQMAPSSGDEAVRVQAVAAVRPATVTVLNQGARGFGSGSGFFISEDGYVVTNHHVVEGARELTIIYATGGQAPATLAGTAPEFDLAVLKVDGAVPAVARWGDSTAVPLGAQVIAIGSALGQYQNSVTEGVLSGFNRSLGALEGLLQTDAAINHGNSGGPLTNSAGEVIGINTMVVRGGQAQAEGLGFAIPSNIARNVVAQLIEHGEVQRPFMGVSFQSVNPQMALEEQLTVSDGAIVREVVPGSPSDRAGLRAGDIIVAIAGQPLDERHTLVSVILEHRVGDEISLVVLRDGATFDTKLILAPRAA